MPIDNVLKLYAKTIRSPFLHYGFWDDPAAVDPARVNLADIAAAQQRYIEHLAGFIPEDVQSILDVGCGIGGNSAYLREQGFKLEALSPDRYQEEVFQQKFDGEIPFHRSKFEKFQPAKEYDLILESESACYIKIIPGFVKAHEVLRDGGYLLAADYFVHHNDRVDSPHLKSSHNIERYLQAAADHGFKLVREYDQTENTVVTLDCAKEFFTRFVEPLLDYGRYSVERKYPRLFKLAGLLLGKHIASKKNQLDLIDSAEFRKHRRYMIYLFQKDGNA